jgi:hypothetical protein
MEITTYSLLGAVAEVVHEIGDDFVYNEGNEGASCQYVRSEAPSCLFGRALHKLGVSIDTLYCGDQGDWDLPGFLADKGLPLRDAWAFSDAQYNQDHEMQYGDVLTNLVAKLKLSE